VGVQPHPHTPCLNQYKRDNVIGARLSQLLRHGNDLLKSHPRTVFVCCIATLFILQSAEAFGGYVFFTTHDQQMNMVKSHDVVGHTQAITTFGQI